MNYEPFFYYYFWRGKGTLVSKEILLKPADTSQQCCKIKVFFLKTVKAMIQMTSIFSSVNSFSHEPVKAVFFLEEDVFQGKIFTDADVDDSLLRRTTPTFEVGLQMREIGAQRNNNDH